MEYQLENVKKAYKNAIKKGFKKQINIEQLFPLNYQNENMIDEIFEFLLKKSWEAKRLPIIYSESGNEDYVNVEMPIGYNSISISEPPVKKVNGKKHYHTNTQDEDGTVYEVRW